jgi:hypothetical protein
VGAALHDERPLGVGAHGRALKARVDDVHRALQHLLKCEAAEILVRTAERDGGPVTEEFWIPGAAHDVWIQRELKVLRWVRQERFAIYVQLPPDTRDAITPSAWSLNPDLTGVITAGTTWVKGWDELAIAAGGEDSREALETARDVWEEVCRRAGLGSLPFVVREILPPVRR